MKPIDRPQDSPDRMARVNQTQDVQARRLQAAIAALLREHPKASPERDPILLRLLGRECRNSSEMEAHRSLLHSAKSQCEEHLLYENGVAKSSHPHHGKTFDELGRYLDEIEPVLAKIREHAEPLPEELRTLWRRTSPAHKATEAADGKFDYKEMYGRGFPHFITSIYASSHQESIAEFGTALETITLEPDATLMNVQYPPWEVEELLEEIGRKPLGPNYDLYQKAGIDVCFYKQTAGNLHHPMYPHRGWFNIFNPEAIESVS